MTRSPLLGLLVAVIGLAAFFVGGERLLDGFVLDLGQLDWPAPRHGTFLFLLIACGSLTAAGFAFALRSRDSLGWIEGVSDRTWRMGTVIAGLLVPLALQQLVLRGVWLTDDEAAYRFGADLLLSGRVSVPSPERPLHFEHAMMVNNGAWHPNYFLGWPALLAPFAWLGVPGLANPMLAAATIPALDDLLDRAAGRRWGRAALLVWLVAPMPAFLAATMLSHTACLAALAWTAWAVMRSRENRMVHHGLVGVFFSIAFFVRPVSALAVGGPLLIFWGLGVVRDRNLRALGAMALPSSVFALAFFGVNAAQNGSPWLPSYVAGAAHHAANGYRFAFVGNQSEPQQAVVLGMSAMFAQTAAGLLRLNFAAFGWPFCFVFLVWAKDRLWWFCLLGGLAGAAVVLDVGIDTFGPVHYAEVLLPLIVLTATGLAGFARRAGDGLAGGVLVGLVLVGTLFFWPVRATNASRIAWSIERPMERVEGLDDALVFAMWPFTAQACDITPTKHLRFGRPLPRPDRSGPVLWANHLTLASDRWLADQFPDRVAYLLFYDGSCEFQLVPLDAVGDGQIRDAFVGGNGDLTGYQ